MAVERFPVEAGHIMLFARSVGDDNQIYYDAEYDIAENQLDPGVYQLQKKASRAGQTVQLGNDQGRV